MLMPMRNCTDHNMGFLSKFPLLRLKGTISRIPIIPLLYTFWPYPFMHLLHCNNAGCK